MRGYTARRIAIWSELSGCSTNLNLVQEKEQVSTMKRNIVRSLRSTIAARVIAVAVAMGFGIVPHSAFAAAGDSFSFAMVPSPGATCLAYNASGAVTINDLGNVQNMHVEVFNMPPKTEFDLFVIQVPNKPFGLARYQVDIVTDSLGHGVADVSGVFGRATFIVATGVAPAPKVFPDNATSNPITNPIQTYHLGLWFNTSAEAVAAGCPATVTPFSSGHDAGIQVLNTGTFPDTQGPLFNIQN